MFWSFFGDALWILALAIMFGASRQAWRRIPVGVKPPLMGVRVPRAMVVWALPGAVFLVSLWFIVQARAWSDQPDLAFIFFGVRAVCASLTALLHLRWLGSAMTALEREGQLKP